MKCLIIAAGEGSRLSNRGNSKPLVLLLELPLIERVILNAKGAGITDFYIVTGYNGEKLRNHLDQFAQNRDLKITHLINNQWKKENGLSVLAAKKEINENFILLMSDHIFDKSILEDLMQEKVADGEIILAVDYNLENKIVDIDGCDGEIARLKFQTSEFGGWYDAVLDRYADAFLLFGLTYYAYFLGENLFIFIYWIFGYYRFFCEQLYC